MAKNKNNRPDRLENLPTPPAEGDIISREVVSVEGQPAPVREAAPGEPLRDEVVVSASTSGETGTEVVRIEGEPEVVRTEAVRVETPRSEHHEVVHAHEGHGAPSSELTQDVYTVGETFDPITHNPAPLHGIMVEFTESEPLVQAVRTVRAAGYKKMDCYSPIPVEGLTEEMGWRDKKVPALMLCGGFTGFTLAWLLQYSGMAWFYPVNIGGKPLNSWPQYIVPAFEMTILFTALSGVVSMLVLNGLPSPYHPVFNAPGFEGASSDRFFLCLESEDPKFDRAQTLQFARTLGGVRVSEVER
jgi:hypothetical protein